MNTTDVPATTRHSIGILTMALLVLAMTSGSAQSAARVVSGYLSGLNRGESVTLLQNGRDALTVTTNGIFNFATPLASGAAYEVSIGAQPASEVCTVDAAGSGSVPEAGVTQVQVSCEPSTDATPAATTSWWIPYTASPQSGTTGGLTGLFLIASNLIHSSPTQEFISTTKSKILGEGIKITAAGLLGAQPMTLMYSAVGTDGNTHIYGVLLNNTAAVPTPAQVTSLSITPAQTICDMTQAQTSLTSGTTLFLVLSVATAPCGSTNPSTYYVIHYKDLPTTKPKKVNISTTQISALYENAKLVGLYLYNAATQSLNYYATNAFTSPTELVTSVASVMPIASTASIADGTTFGGTVFFPAVTGVTASGNALYSVESTSPSTATLIHKGTVSQGAVDNANLYFQDTTSSTAAVFYQVGLTASAPMKLFNAPVTAGLSSYTLIGTDTVHLAFMNSVVAPTSQATISTIPIGVLSTTSTAIAGPYAGTVFEPFLAAPKANDWAANKLFFTIEQFTAGPPVKFTYSSTATPLNTTAPTPKANTAYESLGPGVWQAKGITDTGGGMGGATMNLVNVTTLADSALTTTGGGVYTIPANYSAIFIEVSSSKVGFGDLVRTTSTLPEMGLASDVAGKFIIQVSDPKTDVLY